MPQKHQLAAVLFADIVGYTALMQTNEQQALAQLQKFKITLESQVPTHNGDIIQFYGDGCLVIFNSSVDAVTCAKALQTIYREEPNVPVRIGLHLGDVVFKEDNVFGDAVNIASRVESMGIPGAVLLSSSIRNQIKNKPEFELASLGKFEFKNVEAPMTVYALANQGFPVPKRAELKGKLKTTAPKRNWLIPSLIGLLMLLFSGFWYAQQENKGVELGEDNETFQTPLSKEIRDKRVAVMVFENKTGSEDLEDFGTMISDWITKGLMETGEAKVISAANIKNQIAKLGVSDGPNPEFTDVTGVEVMLQGRYYLQENRLIIHSNIVNIKNGEVIHALESIEKEKSKIVDLLDELTQEVLGYWAIRKSNRFLQNPPKYEAYQAYMENNKFFFSNFNKTETLLKKAFELDTTFYTPLLRLIPLYRNNRKATSADSIIRLFGNKNYKLTQWEKRRLAEQEAFAKRHWKKSAQINEKSYTMDLSNGTAIHNAGINYMYSNRPNKALEAFQLWKNQKRKLGWSSEDKLGVTEGNMAKCYNSIEKYGEALKIVESYNQPNMYVWTALEHLKVLIRLGQLEQVNKRFEKFIIAGIYGDGRYKFPNDYLFMTICNEAIMVNNNALFLDFADFRF